MTFGKLAWPASELKRGQEITRNEPAAAGVPSARHNVSVMGVIGVSNSLHANENTSDTFGTGLLASAKVYISKEKENFVFVIAVEDVRNLVEKGTTRGCPFFR